MASTLSVLATFTIIRSTFNDFIPKEVRECLWRLFKRFSSEFTMVIEETHDGSSNHLFKAAMAYLGSHVLSVSSDNGSPKRLTVGKNENVRKFTFGLDRHSEIVDFFHGVPMKWKYSSDVNTNSNNTLTSEARWYELSFQKKDAEMVKTKYLPHVIDMAKKLKDQNRMVKFHTIRRDRWSTSAVNLDHPMTFETLAMDGDLKKTIVEDLDSFINGKKYYKKIGKVWKRGYLLYGPPGTGKSSLIAAMANHLNFDIYNLNLSAVISDSSLEYLLLHVSNRSILVIEDIDCTVKLQNREAEDQTGTHTPHLQVTLSGLLNAIDGLLSCCGDERIIVFTTNYKDKIDPALLRAGRMDKHICLSYCTVSIFKQLVANYLGISSHDLFAPIEKIIQEVNVSPAEVAGELMKSKNPKTCLNGLIKFLNGKASEATSEKTKLEGEGGDIANQKKKCKSQGSTKTDMSTNGDTPNPNAITFLVAGSNSMIVGEYKVKPELAPILKSVLLKHGDIVANSSLSSIQCRSCLLEIVCGIILKLQQVKFKDLTEHELHSMVSCVSDLESVSLQISWLHERLDEIVETVKLLKQCSTLKEEKRKSLQEIEELEIEIMEQTPELQKKSLQIQELKAVTEKLSETISSTEAKLGDFHERSLVDGLF
ncbi:hypothetical protein PTKIN_Ptkin07bG0301800 [Pterospermum kingtungense]